MESWRSLVVRFLLHTTLKTDPSSANNLECEDKSYENSLTSIEKRSIPRTDP